MSINNEAARNTTNARTNVVVALETNPSMAQAIALRAVSAYNAENYKAYNALCAAKGAIPLAYLNSFGSDWVRDEYQRREDEAVDRLMPAVEAVYREAVAAIEGCYEVERYALYKKLDRSFNV